MRENNKILVLLSLILFFTGCKTVENAKDNIKYVYNSTSSRDTIVMQSIDSVLIYNIGDTIREKTIQIRYFENKSYKIDTLIQKDTVKDVKTITKEVEKKLNKWQKTMQAGGYVLLFTIFAALIYLVFYIIYKIRKK